MRTKSITLFALLFAGSAPRAAEPQATFALVKGELEIRVEQDGTPVKDMKVRVLDLGATTLMDAEEIDGTVSFPLDKRSAYLVGITIPGKKKEADLITLRRTGDSLTPPRVLLGFSKPCCRIAASPRTEAPTPEDDAPRPDKRSGAWFLLGVSGACLLAAGMMLMFLRRP
jgi:hypothetical protein